MTQTVTIFGKKYPAYESNATEYRYVLPDFFNKQKHFSSKEYYDEVIKNHPEYKSLFHPSEKQIQQMIIGNIGWAALDGANSVPGFEKKFGIKIFPDYKYPNNMSDIEYSFYKLQKLGLTSGTGKIPGKGKSKAYHEAWQNLHYPNQNRLKIYQDLYNELISLNPWLNQYKFDTNNQEKLIKFIAGITYKFPIKDIMMFLNGEKPTQEDLKNKLKPLEKYGITLTDFSWIPSDDTIQDIEQKIKHRQNTAQKFHTASKNVKKLQENKKTNFLLRFISGNKHE